MSKPKEKLNLAGGVFDLVIFVLLVGGAGFFGYFVGINQKLAPVQIVAPGTLEVLKYYSQKAAGIIPPVTPSAVVEAEPKPKPKTEKASEVEEKKKIEVEKPERKSEKKPEKKIKASNPATVKASKATLKEKFWIASSGHDYIGSSVTVVVNGHPVDNFFGPGKLIDISKHVKSGLNELSFESKILADDYNQHLGNNEYDLTLKLVSGSSVREDFEPSAVLLTFKRTAADVEDSVDTMKFRVQ